MYDKIQLGTSANALRPSTADRPLNRIESNIETLKDQANRLEAMAESIAAHARSLGYFELSSNAKGESPTPVVTTMSDAIMAVQRAVDHCVSALGLFD